MSNNAQPSTGENITKAHGNLIIPDNPIIPHIVGDGIGPDIWQATQPVLDAAVSLAYQKQRHLCWMEVLAGESALASLDTLLPSTTVDAFYEHSIGLKGPLATPVGGGFRSLNVTLRSQLDLYVCMRPVVWIPGTPSPVRHPERVNMVVFRENTEDIYAGIEFEQGSEANFAFLSWLKATYPDAFDRIRFPNSAGIGIKPISQQGSQRFIRAVINHALLHKRKKITMVHKGNIMKFTEGAFAKWGYDLAESVFADKMFTQRQYQQYEERNGVEAANQLQDEAVKTGKLLLNDVITDAAFEQTLNRPEDFDVIATTNLNGDYLSDALSAQAGGLGIAPGANINDEEKTAIFEATHGTAPTLAGKNIANPSSLILSGALMLEYMDWIEAAQLIRMGLQKTLQQHIYTFDFQRSMKRATRVSTTDFGQAVIRAMQEENQTQS